MKASEFRKLSAEELQTKLAELKYGKLPELMKKLSEAQDTSSPSILRDHVTEEEIAKIQTILHDLNEPYKEVFLWRVYGELSFKQIAQIFEKNENWACVTYHRARKMILQRLEESSNENFRYSTFYH